jgi:hypothetical protein
MKEMTRELLRGQIVWLDIDMVNSGQVEVVRQTPLRKFTTVKSDNSEWDVMTYRLTPVEDKQSNP